MAFRKGVRNCSANGRATVGKREVGPFRASGKEKGPAGNVYNVGTLKSIEQRNSHE